MAARQRNGNPLKPCDIFITATSSRRAKTVVSPRYIRWVVRRDGGRGGARRGREKRWKPARGPLGQQPEASGAGVIGRVFGKLSLALSILRIQRPGRTTSTVMPPYPYC